MVGFIGFRIVLKQMRVSAKPEAEKSGDNTCTMRADCSRCWAADCYYKHARSLNCLRHKP